MRCRLLEPEQFRVFLSSFLPSIDNDDRYSIFGSRGIAPSDDDDLIGAALVWIEKTLEAIPDITTTELVDAFLKKGYKTRYLQVDLLSDTLTVFHAGFQYLDAALAWQTSVDATAALLLGSYLILGGILYALGIVEF
jgi:hypothetical protein